MLGSTNSKFFLVHGNAVIPSQSYWSMKYHSIILPTIQKYAGLGFGEIVLFLMRLIGSEVAFRICYTQNYATNP